MEKKSQVLVTFKAGAKIAYNVGGYEDFAALVGQLQRWFKCWIIIGSSCVVRKKDIDRVYYFEEGCGKGSEHIVS